MASFAKCPRCNPKPKFEHQHADNVVVITCTLFARETFRTFVGSIDQGNRIEIGLTTCNCPAGPGMILTLYGMGATLWEFLSVLSQKCQTPRYILQCKLCSTKNRRRAHQSSWCHKAKARCCFPWRRCYSGCCRCRRCPSVCCSSCICQTLLFVPLLSPYFSTTMQVPSPFAPTSLLNAHRAYAAPFPV